MTSLVDAEVHTCTGLHVMYEPNGLLMGTFSKVSFISAFSFVVLLTKSLVPRLLHSVALL